MFTGLDRESYEKILKYLAFLGCLNGNQEGTVINWRAAKREKMNGFN